MTATASVRRAGGKTPATVPTAEVIKPRQNEREIYDYTLLDADIFDVTWHVAGCLRDYADVNRANDRPAMPAKVRVKITFVQEEEEAN
jgi:hypothetical protein